MSLPGLVFRCFKCLERTADKVTGAAGPFFIGVACTLMSAGLFAFFDVVAPTLSLPIISIPLCLLVATNMLAHYYYVCTVPPGFADDPRPIMSGKKEGWEWAARRRSTGASRRESWDEEGVGAGRASVTKCTKCGSTKPERTHHCRVCGRCVLKYDHHCPWINQCVGIHNERHFVLFMGWLVVATFCFVILGHQKFWDAFGFYSEWEYLTPRTMFLLVYIISIALGLAVGVMFSWHIWLICNGQTSVESHDFAHYRKVAKGRGDVFVNAFDLGPKRNLALFFNLTESGYSISSLFLPLRTHPYTDGRSWARREGYDRHGGVRREEELTDDDEDND